MTADALTLESATRRLQEAESEIRSLGVARLSVFGSVARNEARPDSDVDVLVQFRERKASIGSWTWRNCWRRFSAIPSKS
ncbi:MAG: nucleotidyltransferase domain-containing protein [Gemmatimonadota bacterium]|nr:nucleotidyltransferase domain-containing protein [Gemmatimonadota bacterium]